MAKKAEVDVLEVLELGDVVVQIGDKEFTQKPLSFFGKIKLFSVLSSALRKMLDQDVSIAQILDVPEDGALPLDRINDANNFVKSITKVVEYAPEFIGDIYCVILGVSESDKEAAKVFLEENLDDDTAFEILDTFVDQNWELLVDFFTKKGMPLFQKITGKFQESAQ